MKEIAEAIRNLAERKGVTPKELHIESGVSRSRVYELLKGEANLSLMNFVQICNALGIDIVSFITREGRPEIADGSDLRAMAEEYLRQASPTELMEIRIMAVGLMPWLEIWRTRDVRNKALEDDTASDGLRALALNEYMWFQLRPSGAEIEQLEKHGKHETAEDYMADLIALRRKERKAVAALQASKKPSRKRRKAVSMSELIEIPIYGAVAAGHPIEAINGNHDTVRVDSAMIRDPKRAYALKVAGDSMIEEDIRDGDIIVVNASETAQPGQTVVALIDGEEATVKKYWPEGHIVRLKPANPDYQPMIYPAEKVKIQGIVAGLIRGF